MRIVVRVTCAHITRQFINAKGSPSKSNIELKVMRSRNFYSMNFLLIWYKDSFRVNCETFFKLWSLKSSRNCAITLRYGAATLGSFRAICLATYEA